MKTKFVNESLNEFFNYPKGDGDDEENIEFKIIDYLNQAENSMTAEEFSGMAESIINYIDEIDRKKRRT